MYGRYPSQAAILGTTLALFSLATAHAQSSPSITILGENPLQVDRFDAFVDPGALAESASGGDLTFALRTTGFVTPAYPGRYRIEYSVTDFWGQSTVAVREVEVLDDTPPAIALAGPAELTVDCDSVPADPGATARDTCDGFVAVTSDFDAIVDTQAIAGPFVVTYTASDGAGNMATATRTVFVTGDSCAPIVEVEVAATAQALLEETATAGAMTFAAAADIVSGLLIAQFDALDRNGNGLLSSDELVAGSAPAIHSADTNGDGRIDAAELRRLIHLYNADSYGCAGASTADGFVAGGGNTTDCLRHASDYRPFDFAIGLQEVMRAIQLHRGPSYTPIAPVGTSEDGYLVASPAP